MSIESSYLETIANHVKNDVNNVLINNSIVISSFDTEIVTTNEYEVVFTVLASQTTLITNVKLRNISNVVIDDNDVNIPIAANEAIIRQTITISEVL